jgi:hypothetical protein
VDFGAFRSPNPVPLSRPGSVRPIDLVQVVEQALRVVADAEKPLRQEPLLDLAAAALAGARDDLFVGQDRLIRGAPVHRRFFPVGQPPLEELDEDPLGPAVVVRVRGVDDIAPVDHQPGAFQLPGEVRDVTGE